MVHFVSKSAVSSNAVVSLTLFCTRSRSAVGLSVIGAFPGYTHVLFAIEHWPNTDTFNDYILTTYLVKGNYPLFNHPGQSI